MLQPQMKAPDFKAMAVVDGQFKEISFANYRGKYVVLFFYPLDFTFVCPTEITAFSDRIHDFHDRNCEVIGVSTDSHFSHLAWINTPRQQGGLGKMSYPLVSDFTKTISREYGVLHDKEGVAFRGLFLIDKEGIVRHMVVNDLPLGRSVEETLRMIDALSHFEKNGEVCPIDWKPGKDAIIPSPQESKKFFQKAAAVHA